MVKPAVQEIALSTVWTLARPASLWLTVVACLLGWASAAACAHQPDGPSMLATLILAAGFHASANMLQETGRSVGGADVRAPRWLCSWTGGFGLASRGVIDVRQTRQLAWAVLALVVLAGVLLAFKTASGVIWLGVAGVILVWAYALPPLHLGSRGFGAIIAAVSWWLVVLGADWVQRRYFFFIPAINAVSFALLVANVHLMASNVIRRASSPVARRPAPGGGELRGSAAVYGIILVIAHLWLVGGVMALYQPQRALWGVLSLPLSTLALVFLWFHDNRVDRLHGALGLSIAAAVVHGLAMAAGLASMYS